LKRYSIQKQPAILELKKQIALKIKRDKDFILLNDKMPYSWFGVLKINEQNIIQVEFKNFIILKGVNYVHIRDGFRKHLTIKELKELNELLT
jgi:hypothetical protein